MNHEIEIKPMMTADIPSVCTVWKQSGLVISDYEREQYELQTLMAANPTMCLIATAEKQIIGTIIGANNGRRVWIYHLAVLPDWQGKGVGSLLLSKVEEKATQQGATKLLLGVGLSNLKVVPFYEKQGYSVMNDMVLFQKMLPWKGGEHT
jgi:GNAT superfamily N-acetyltransferase